MSDSDIGRSIRRSLHLLTYATALLYVVVLVLLGVGWQDSHNKAADLQLETERTNSALCTFRADLEQRVHSSRAFLVAHPHGILGISAATIQSGIDNQQRTIDALASLDC
jgi:hypothetical protein